MLRGSKTPLKVKENEQKEEASLPPPRGQKSCKVTKPRAIRSSKKENFTDRRHTRTPKCAVECPKGLEEDLCHSQRVDESWQLPGSCSGALRGDVLTESPLPLHTKEDFCSSQAVPLGNDFLTPERDKVEGKLDFGLSEEKKKPVDFASVISAEFGIAQGSFGKQSTGASPTSLKFRRRSTIGLRGSPENNTLIRYLAQQRSSRQRGAFTQISPFKPANVRSLKDKIDAFQASFESLQEADGEAGLTHLGPPSQECPSQNKAPFKKEPNLEQWREKFMLGNRGAALKENLSENGTKSSRSELRICSILSPHRAGTVTDSSAAKEWVYEGQTPVKSLETVVTGDTLETGHVPRCDHSDAVPDPSSSQDVSLGMLSGIQTPVGAANIPSSDLCQSSSLLRSILKKTPGRELRDSTKENSDSAIAQGGDEHSAVSNGVKAFETLQTAETTDSESSKTPKKKKVTFGEVLSPEIFDQSLPANTPLRRGASPGQSPWARPGLSEQPLPLLDLAWDDEGVEPLPEPLEDSVAAQAPSPVENTNVAETDKPDTMTTHSSPKRKCRAVPEDPDCSSSGATDTENDKGTKNPRRSKVQRQKNPTLAAPKKSQKTKRPSYGKRRKKKVKKSLYGEREMASKKPLLSPIPEIPEVLSSDSSPNSPKADALFTEGAGLGNPRLRDGCRDGCRDSPQEPQAGRKLCAAAECPRLLQEAAASEESLESATNPQFSNTVPNAEGDFDTSEYFQQGKETPCEKEAKESSSLLEKEELQGNLQTGLEIVEQQNVQEAAQRTKSPPKDSVRVHPARRTRRSSSAFHFPPAENLVITGADLAVSSFNVEEFFSVPRPEGGSLQGCRSSAELKVRRSMRLSRDAASEGLAWIEIPRLPPLPAAPKGRRSISTSILAGSENIHHREQNLPPVPAPGKENQGSAAAAAAAGRRCRRRSLCEAAAQEMPWAPTQRRRSTNSGCGKDRSNKKHLEGAEMLGPRLEDVSGISGFLK